VIPPTTSPARATPHVCDAVEPDGRAAGACHLWPPHGGPCATCGAFAADCAHQADWVAVLLCSVRDCEVHR